MVEVTLLVWRLLGVAAGLIVAAQLACEPCQQTELWSEVAPSGAHRAVLFELNCGATTQFSRHVWIGLSGDRISPRSGNVLTIDAGWGNAEEVLDDILAVAVEWESGQSLSVTYDARARVYMRDSLVAGVQISFQERAPPNAQ